MNNVTFLCYVASSSETKHYISPKKIIWFHPWSFTMGENTFIHHCVEKLLGFILIYVDIYIKCTEVNNE